MSDFLTLGTGESLFDQLSEGERFTLVLYTDVPGVNDNSPTFKLVRVRTGYEIGAPLPTFTGVWTTLELCQFLDQFRGWLHDLVEVVVACSPHNWDLFPVSCLDRDGRKLNELFDQLGNWLSFDDESSGDGTRLMLDIKSESLDEALMSLCQISFQVERMQTT